VTDCLDIFVVAVHAVATLVNVIDDDDDDDDVDDDNNTRKAILEKIHGCSNGDDGDDLSN
jgi:hypothetical protein